MTRTPDQLEALIETPTAELPDDWLIVRFEAAIQVWFEVALTGTDAQIDKAGRRIVEIEAELDRRALDTNGIIGEVLGR